MKKIEEMTQALKESLCVIPPVGTSALKTAFNEERYGEVLVFIKKTLGIGCKINVRCPSAYPETQPPACIKVPTFFPLIGTKEYKEMELEIIIRKEVFDSFHKFMMVLSHEMAHAVLYGINHPLKKSEAATDITAMILGFSREFFLVHKEVYLRSIFSRSFYSPGYLTIEEVCHIASLLDIELEP